MIRALASLLLLCTLASDADPAQASDGPVIAGVRVGFAGRYKAGLWTPVEITLEGDVPAAAELAVTVPDGDGVPSRVVAPLGAVAGVSWSRSRGHEVELGDISRHAHDERGRDTRFPQQEPSDSSTRGGRAVLRCVRFGRVRSSMTVELRAGGQVLSRRVFQAGTDFPEAVPSERGLILSVAPDSMGVEEAVTLLAQGSKGKTAVARVDDPHQLPTQWYGYEGVDTLLLSTSRPETLAFLTASDGRIDALDEWVQMGGRLVFCVGREGESVLGPGAPLARFAPGRFQKMVSLRQTRTLESYSGGAASISSAGPEFRVPLLADVCGKVEAWEGNLPLVVRGARGFGQIVFLAADLDQPPLNGWADRGRLVAQLLGNVSAGGREADESAAVLHYGYTDMAGQLRSALDHFDGVWPVPFWLVVSLVILYVLAIGPGDYFLLSKVLRRMELTWITFPLAVAAVGLAALFLADRFKGDRVRVSQISMVDVDVESGRLRATAWANVFSPKTSRYNLAFELSLPGGRGAEPAQVLTAWLGLPGSALGGMDPQTTAPDAWREGYEFTPRLDALSGVPIPVWSTRSFTARWTAPAAAYPKADLVLQGELPVGAITNTLDFPLRGCLLAYGRWAYPLGTIEPGESFEVGPMVLRRELRMLLTGRKMVYDEADEQFRQRSTPYDRGSDDPSYVLRAMAFYEAAGGRRYTGLVNRYQTFIDLSHLLVTGRAVLMAVGPADESQAPDHGARLLRDAEPIAEGSDRHPTIYRFVYPVRSERP